MLNKEKSEKGKRNHTSQNGITLIALIITIIVMLILVGVTINVALNGGLFTKASEASKQMQVEADRETLLSAVVAAIGYDGKVVLADIELPTGWTGGDGTYTSPKGNTFTVDENGKITEGGEQDKEEVINILGLYGNKTELGFEFLENGKGILYKGKEKDGDDGQPVMVVTEYNFTYNETTITLGNNRETGEDPRWDNPTANYIFSVQKDENTGEIISKSVDLGEDIGILYCSI